MNGQSRLKLGNRAGRRRTGFTLIELLVVMLILLLVSAVVLPTVIPAIAHRQVSEAARILQGALAGARDLARNNNAPAGIRLLPDPVLNGIDPSNGRLDPTRILASNRYVPIQLAPDYTEGRVSIINDVVSPFGSSTLPYDYPGGGVPYPVPNPGRALMVEECPVYQDPSTGIWLRSSPTSWFWNIRVGDRIQIGNAPQVYVVVGPLWVSPVNPNPAAQGNDDLFVNIGTPGNEQPNYALSRTYPDGTRYSVEYLLLVNGQDDNNNGYVDDGWDGIDNDGFNGQDDPQEWEIETWLGGLASLPILPTSFSSLTGILNQSYTITRRPVVAPAARETLLPSNVVVDLTTWNPGPFGAGFVSERSRLPVDATTGAVDILLNPNGTVVPTTKYSSPSSFGMGWAFYQFWLAERGDLFDPPQAGTTWTATYLLPMLPNTPNYPNGNDTTQRTLKGERRLVTLYTRTGQMITNQLEDSSFNGNYPSLPFQVPQQGVTGDTR